MNGLDRPSLLKAIFKTFWREYAILGCICFVNDVFIRLSQPYLLGRLLLYFRWVHSHSHSHIKKKTKKRSRFDLFILIILIVYFFPNRKDSEMPRDEAIMYASGIVALSACSGLIINQFFIVGFHNGMKVRVAVCSVIYRKVRIRLIQL